MNSSQLPTNPSDYPEGLGFDMLVGQNPVDRERFAYLRLPNGDVKLTTVALDINRGRLLLRTLPISNPFVGQLKMQAAGFRIVDQTWAAQRANDLHKTRLILVSCTAKAAESGIKHHKEEMNETIS